MVIQWYEWYKKNQAKHHGINQHLFCKYLGDDHKIFKGPSNPDKEKEMNIRTFQGKTQEKSTIVHKGEGGIMQENGRCDKHRNAGQKDWEITQKKMIYMACGLNIWEAYTADYQHIWMAFCKQQWTIDGIWKKSCSIGNQGRGNDTWKLKVYNLPGYNIQTIY